MAHLTLADMASRTMADKPKSKWIKAGAKMKRAAEKSTPVKEKIATNVTPMMGMNGRKPSPLYDAKKG